MHSLFVSISLSLKHHSAAGIFTCQIVLFEYSPTHIYVHLGWRAIKGSGLNFNEQISSFNTIRGYHSGRHKDF